MFKKNLIGTIIVLLIFAGFYAGYMLGKSSGGFTPGMRPGMPVPGGQQVPSSPRPTSQGEDRLQNAPEVKPSDDVHRVNAQEGKDEAAPAASVVNVAWAEPMENTQSGEQIPNRQQGRRRPAGITDDGMMPQGRPQGRPPVAALQEEQETVAIEKPVLEETPEEILIQEQKSTSGQVFYGTAVPYAEANVQSKQGGTITLLKGKEGDAVTRGAVIVRFDDRDTQLELQQAIASKNSALQQVNQAQSNFQTIQADLKRYQQLFKDGFVSKQQVDSLQNQLASATSTLNSAKESVTQKDVQVKMIENTLKDFLVKAPISGVIDLKNYNLSEVYQGGGVIYHLIDIEQVYVEVEIPETYLKKVHEGITVSVVFDAVGEQPFGGILETILPSGTADNRSFTAKVLVQNPELSIKPGMFARIEMSGDSST